MPIRAGSDIVFLGAIINYVLEHERYFKEYVVSYTNASAIIDERFQDTEDLDGLFSGWDPERKTYDNTTWQYAGTDDGDHAEGEHESETGQQHGGIGAPLDEAHAPRTDPTLQHPNCVFQLLRKHFRRYTPELVEEVCGVPPELFGEVAETLCENSGRERTSGFAYAVGWTQHTVGAQSIRTAAILQLLLGNIGRPGGGIMALRGHASIQGSTDIPTLYNLLPGYLPMPNAEGYPDLAAYIEQNTKKGGFWGHTDAYLISLLKAYYGDRATADNDYCFDYLPRISGDHSTYPTTLAMLDGKVKGYFLFGENPAVGSANSGLHRKALAKLDWLVVRDLVEIESATFWRDAPEIESGELRTTDIGTEVFFLPAASHVEKGGHLHQHPAAAPVAREGPRPQGRLPLGPVVHLPPGQPGPGAAGRLGRAQGPGRARPGLGVPDRGGARRPQRRGGAARDQRLGTRRQGAVQLRGAQGRRLDHLRLLDLLRLLRRRGQPAGPAQAPQRAEPGSRPSGAGPGRSTAASSTTGPRPTPTASPGRNASAMSGGTRRPASGPAWTCPTSPRPSGPTTGPVRVPRPSRSTGATSRSSCRSTAVAGCSPPPG